MSEPSPSPAPSLLQLPGSWDAVSATYAAEAGQWTDYAHEALRTLPVGPTDRVLDVACGPGTLAFAAAARASQVDAVDFSPLMIDELVARASREGVTNVQAAVMDAQTLEYPDAVFDAAFNLFSFFFFPDRARAFREMLRVLRPGKSALIVTWSPIERRPIMRIALEAAAEALPELPRQTKGDLQDPEECVREMSSAGFQNVSAHLFTASVRIESVERYRDFIVRSAAPLAVMKKKLSEAEWNAAMARFLDALRSRIPEGGTDLSAEAIFTKGTR